MDFDSNSWYRLTTAASMEVQQSMTGTFPYISGEEGLVTYDDSNNMVPNQQWQLFPTGPFTFMLRTKASGPNGFLATERDNRTRTHAIPRIYNHSNTDNSMLWKVLPWGDGTFHFSNKAHGKDCHLEFRGAGGIGMTTNITQPQPGQAFSFVKLGEINDSAFSTVNLPKSTQNTSAFRSRTSTSIPDPTVRVHTVSTTMATSTSTSTASNFPSSSFSSVLSGLPTLPAEAQQSSPRLSPSAAMGIGVTIGVVGLIAVTALVLFFYQRWKSHHFPESQHYRQAKLWEGFTPATSARNTTIQDKPSDNVYVAELPVPASPPAILSPPLSGGHISWGNHMSWQTFPGSPIVPITPTTPTTPPTPPTELPA